MPEIMREIVDRIRISKELEDEYQDEVDRNIVLVKAARIRRDELTRDLRQLEVAFS